MFGYVSANPKMMTDEETRRYRSGYCGLCRCLGQRHGQLTRLSLTYDMTFLALFLSAMYEPEEKQEGFRCMMHTKGTHTAVITRYTEYAADMNVLLAYLNCLDNWRDDRNLAALVESAVFKAGYRRAEERHPRQAEAVSRELAGLAKLEAQGCANPDLPANCFGRLLGEMFVTDESDHFAADLRQFGFYLGKFIYLYDACLDFEEDRAKGKYNPFVCAGYEAMERAVVQQILTVYIAPCVEIYRTLPIVQDSGLIENILYSGVWQVYQKRFPAPESGVKTDERPL